MNKTTETPASPIDRNSLLIRKATWIAQQTYPFITADDVAECAADLVEEETGKLHPALTAQDIADFTCDVIAEV